MRLYTIAGVHANTYGAFTITVDALGAAPAPHPHAIGDVNNLFWNLTQLAQVGHTHAALQNIIADGEGNTAVTQQVNFALSGGITLSVVGSDLQFDYVPSGDGTETIGYLKNANSSGEGAYKIATGDATILASYNGDTNGPALALIQGI